ncbi:hypothetical protein HIM_03061 [Hirsutella minnesotensis 3608]|nr:hypothetical protein HIM_03061 [Hirsutella minnesotensis 3608]
MAADGLRRAADQLDRCAHLPVVDGGAQMMQMMQALMDRFDRLEQNMRRGFVNVGERIDALDQRVVASNKNLVARIQNSVVNHRAVDLAPLCNAVTGQHIEGFPRTLGDLESLNIRQVDALLQELDEPVQGTADDRRRRLKHTIGLTTRAV